MNHAFLEQLQTRQTSLSRSEAKVGAWILANPAEAVDASVQKVAAHASVSEPTVIRFCRSMGLGGFRELKTQLIASLQKSESYLHHDVSDADSPGSAAVKVLESAISALVDLRREISAMPFEAAVERMVEARQIVFTGLGASSHVAEDMRHKFFRLGIPCVAVTDPPTLLQQAAVSSADDVWVVISHTGTWPALVEAMAFAVARGATVLAVTDPGSALARLATILFPCHADEDTNIYTPMSSRLAQLTLLDALQVSVALQMGSEAEENLRSTKAALSARAESGRQH